MNNPYKQGTVRWCMYETLTIRPEARDDKILAYEISVNIEYGYNVLKYETFYKAKHLNEIPLCRILQAEREGVIKYRSSHERAWRNAQLKHHHLRGKDYDKRHGQAKEMAKEYAKS